LLKKSDLKEIVTEIFKQLSESLKKEIKKEIMSEMKIEVEKVKSEFTSKISNLNNELDSLEFGNSNLFEKKISTLR
jgi:phage host-nuclease inhibitor protein Gam